MSFQLGCNRASLVPRLPPFLVLRFAFSKIHGSGRARKTERKPENKRRGKPGNEAIIMLHVNAAFVLCLIWAQQQVCNMS